MLRFLRLAIAAAVGLGAGWVTGFIRGTSADAPRPTLELSCFCAHGDEIFRGEVASYRRSYMDTPRPFSNYRFLDEFNRALGHDMDRALDPAAGGIVLRRPALLFYALFGYLLPVAFEPAVVLRKEA